MAVLAPSLIILRNEINKKWPNRDRSTDGWIGDPSHATTGRPENGGSDHNPNRRGIVDAIDVDVDGISCQALVSAAIRHPSCHYVIWNRHIWSSDHLAAGGLPEQRRYTGRDPHTNHLHISIKQSTAAENRTTGWGIAAANTPIPLPAPSLTLQIRLARVLPVLKAGSTAAAAVRRGQALLNIPHVGLAVDGLFGPATLAAVKALQRAKDLAVDGIVGPKTWAVLTGPMPTVRRGSSGDPVRRGQALLTVNGVKVAADGLFGPATQAAAELVQARYGLDRDGIIGPVTWTALLTR